MGEGGKSSFREWEGWERWERGVRRGMGWGGVADGVLTSGQLRL